MACHEYTPISVKISQELHHDFETHVINSCLCPKIITYFSTGVAEECVEFLDVINLILKKNVKCEGEGCGQKLDHNLSKMVLSEAGDLMWYIYALSFTLPGGHYFLESQDKHEKDPSIKPVSCFPGSRIENNLIPQDIFKSLKTCDLQDLNDLKNCLCSAMGKLCGSIKKFSRGDKPWDTFHERIQRDMDNLLFILESNLFCLSKKFNDKNLTLENAMRCNIQKIAGRMSKGTIKGDGEIR